MDSLELVPLVMGKYYKTKRIGAHKITGSGRNIGRIGCDAAGMCMTDHGTAVMWIWDTGSVPMVIVNIRLSRKYHHLANKVIEYHIEPVPTIRGLVRMVCRLIRVEARR